MIVSSPQPAPQRTPGREPLLRTGVAAVLLVVLGVQAVLRLLACSTRSVHWDEFNFLSIVHAAQRNELSSVFHTFHARIFFWLSDLGLNDVDQIILARYVIWVGHVTALGALALVGRRLLGWLPSLWALCMMGSAWFVIQHGCSFRYDGLLLPLYAVSLWLLMQRHRAATPLAAVLGAMAVLISLKAALFSVPLLAFLMFGRGEESRLEKWLQVRRYLLWGGGTLCLFAALHWRGLATDAPESGPGDYSRGMFHFLDPFPRSYELSQTLHADRGVWLFLLLGAVLLLGSSLRTRGVRSTPTALAFLVGTPLLSVTVYRNAWPYFIATVMTVSALWLASVPALLTRTERSWQRQLVLVAMLAFGVHAGTTAYRWHSANSDNQTERQREVIATVKALFPEPTPYIDRCGMIASYPKVGPFMTSFGMDRYRRAGVPVFESILHTRQPSFLLANVSGLDLGAAGAGPPGGVYKLFSEDWQILKANFVHHWGPLWVAGKVAELTPELEHDINVLISGTYTLEANQPVSIDQLAPIHPGESLHLQQGPHTLTAQRAGTIRLRIGARLGRPARPPPPGALLEGFHFRRPGRLSR